MRNLIALLLLCTLLSCAKDSSKPEETNTATPAEQKIIDAASTFFKSTGEYRSIQNNYRVALSPFLTVRKTLTEGACTSNIFEGLCCCPYDFSMSPYDDINGTVTNFNYPKSVSFTAKPGKMQGSFSAIFESRPISQQPIEVRYTNLAFTGTDVNLNGSVMVSNVTISPDTHNPLFTAEFFNNSFSTPLGQISSISGNLSYTDGDASGKLTIIYEDKRMISVEVTLSDMPVNGSYAAFPWKAKFTTDGVTSDIDFEKETITIGSHSFSLSLD